MYHPNMCIIYLVCMITSIERKSYCFPILCQLCPFKEQKKSLSVEFAQAGKSPVYCSCFFPFTFAPLVAILQYPWSSWNASGPAKPGVSQAERGCLDVTTSRSLQRWVNICKNDDPNKHGTWSFLEWWYQNGGTSKSSTLIGFSIIYHPFCGSPIFGNTQMLTLKFHSKPFWLWKKKPPAPDPPQSVEV